MLGAETRSLCGAAGSLRGERLSVSKKPPSPAPSHPQVRSPLSDSILGEQALAVTDDKVSVLELRVQPVMGISLALSRGTAHPGEVTATCWAQSALPAPKQVTAGDRGDEVSISRWGPMTGGMGGTSTPHLRVFRMRTDCLLR